MENNEESRRLLEQDVADIDHVLAKYKQLSNDVTERKFVDQFESKNNQYLDRIAFITSAENEIRNVILSHGGEDYNNIQTVIKSKYTVKHDITEELLGEILKNQKKYESRLSDYREAQSNPNSIRDLERQIEKHRDEITRQQKFIYEIDAEIKHALDEIEVEVISKGFGS